MCLDQEGGEKPRAGGDGKQAMGREGRAFQAARERACSVPRAMGSRSRL